MSTSRSIDVESMRKGDVLPAAFVAERVGVSRSSREYPLALVGLVEYIEGELRRLDREWTVVSERDGIRILTDEEAVAYNEGLREAGLKKVRKARRKQAAVDVGALDVDTRRHHDWCVDVDARLDEMHRRLRRRFQWGCAEA